MYSMSFIEMLDYGLNKYRSFKTADYIYTYMQLEYIKWSYTHYDNKPEFARLLHNDVLALLSI